MKSSLFFAAALALILSGCTIISQQQVPNQMPQTQLQTRQFQQREYDTADVKLIMKAVLNVLQDDGFTVKNAVVDLGLLSAVKEIDLANSRRVTNQNEDFWEQLFRGLSRTGPRNNTNSSPAIQRFEKLKVIDATININEFGRTTRVRASFQAKVLDNVGDVVAVNVVDDGRFYQEFFAKVDKGIFLQKQKL